MEQPGWASCASDMPHTCTPWQRRSQWDELLWRSTDQPEHQVPDGQGFGVAVAPFEEHLVGVQT